MTLREFWSEFKVFLRLDLGLQPSTIKQKRKYLRFATENGLDLTKYQESPEAAEETAREYLYWVKQERGPSAYNNYVKLLNNLNTYLEYDKHYSLGPRNRRKPRRYRKDELDALKNWTHEGGNRLLTYRDRAILYWALGTGMRPQEAYQVDVDHLHPANNLEESAFEVRNPAKDGYEREVPIEPTVWSPKHPIGAWLRHHPLIPHATKDEDREPLQELKARLNLTPPGTPLWVTSQGKITRLSKGTVRNRLWNIGNAQGVHANWNRARHTRATKLLRSGMDLRYVQFYLGHIDIDSTTIYAEANTGDVANAMQSSNLHR